MIRRIFRQRTFMQKLKVRLRSHRRVHVDGKYRSSRCSKIAKKWKFDKGIQKDRITFREPTAFGIGKEHKFFQYND